MEHHSKQAIATATRAGCLPGLFPVFRDFPTPLGSALSTLNASFDTSCLCKGCQLTARLSFAACKSDPRWCLRYTIAAIATIPKP